MSLAVGVKAGFYKLGSRNHRDFAANRGISITEHLIVGNGCHCRQRYDAGTSGDFHTAQLVMLRPQ